MSSAPDFTLIERCRGCRERGEGLRQVLCMDPMPLAGQFCGTREEARGARRYPLTWVECGRCGLVQVLEDIDDRVLFGRYNYASSSVPGLVRHFDAYARWLEARLGEREVRLLEVGCNDGVLLSRLPAGWTLVGVDPSDVAGRVAEPRYELVPAAFTAKLAEDRRDKETFDVVTGSNCFAHIRDLRDVFEGARIMLRPGGLFILEVHDLAATLAGSQWDTIYHEHKAEWSLPALEHCLFYAGFSRELVERLPLHGGLLRAVFKKRAEREHAPAPAAAPGSYESLCRAYETRRDAPAYRRLASLAERGQAIAAYGASGRANVWLNQHPELEFRYIVDDAPLRAHRFIPCVATPIVPSSRIGEDPADAVLITAWNHAADIRGKHLAFAGEWLQAFADEAGFPPG